MVCTWCVAGYGNEEVYGADVKSQFQYFCEPSSTVRLRPSFLPSDGYCVFLLTPSSCVVRKRYIWKHSLWRVPPARFFLVARRAGGRSIPFFIFC